jgi:hypothetical protein
MVKKIKKKKEAKFLKKPQGKLKTFSAEKFVESIARQQGPLVRDVSDKYYNIPQDNRSLFFKEEYKNEKSKEFGGFL